MSFSDELSGWFRAFDQYKQGRGRDVAAWLEMHRAGSFTVDRKTGSRKVIQVSRAGVAVLGGIQPGILSRVLGGEYLENGLGARFLMSYPPMRVQEWTEAEISEQVQASYQKLVEKLLAQKMLPCTEGDLVPEYVQLDESAKALWVEYYNEHGREKASLNGHLASVWSKLEAYTARLALILHCIRQVSDRSAEKRIDGESMRSAINLSRWFSLEATRVYGAHHEDPQATKTQHLVDLIKNKGGAVTLREWMRSRSKSTAAEAKRELDKLVSLGRGTWEEGKRGSNTFKLADN